MELSYFGEWEFEEKDQDVFIKTEHPGLLIEEPLAENLRMYGIQAHYVDDTSEAPPIVWN